MATLNGFTPSRQPVPDWIRNFPAAANANGANQTIAKGDAVAVKNGIVVPASSGQDPALVGFGVVIAVYTTANRPLTFQTDKILVTAAVGRVDVCFDPNQTYYVRCDTSIGLSDIGKNLTLTVSAANTRTGISGHSVAIPASASVNDLFKLINIGPFDELSGKGTGGTANNGAEVKWNRHLLHAATVNA